MSRRRGKGGSGKARQRLNSRPDALHLNPLTLSKASDLIRASRKGISAIFSLNADGTLATDVLLYDARHPAMSRTVHMLEMEKYLQRPLDAQLSHMVARWRAEQAGLGGRT